MKCTFLFSAGLGASIGKVIFWFLSPGIGPTTKIFCFDVLYGEIFIFLVSSFSSSDNLSFGASVKPYGKIITAPTFKDPFVPSPVTCFNDKS